MVALQPPWSNSHHGHWPYG